jgi:ABC-type Fe3+ transport system substrate-binding protein
MAAPPNAPAARGQADTRGLPRPDPVPLLLPAWVVIGDLPRDPGRHDGHLLFPHQANFAGGVIWDFTLAAYDQFFLNRGLFGDEPPTHRDGPTSWHVLAFGLAGCAGHAPLSRHRLSHCMVHRDPPAPKAARLWLFLITVPYWVNLLIRTVSLRFLLRDQGPLNEGLLIRLRPDRRAARPASTPIFAVQLGLFYSYLPVHGAADIRSGGALRHRACRKPRPTSGPRAGSTLREVVIPAVRPGIVAGCILVFIPSLGSPSSPPTCWAVRKTYMIGSLIDEQFKRLPRQLALRRCSIDDLCAHQLAADGAGDRHRGGEPGVLPCRRHPARAHHHPHCPYGVLHPLRLPADRRQAAGHRGPLRGGGARSLRQPVGNLPLRHAADVAAGHPRRLHAGLHHLARRLHHHQRFEYMPQELVDKFTAETGIEVTIDTYDSNEAMLASLKAGRMGQYDVAVPGDYMVEIMAGEGLLDSFEPAELPNFANIQDQWVDVPFDPGRRHSIPYQWGSTAFSVNRDVYTGDINSTDIIFNPPEELRGRINVLDSQGEVLALASLHMGIPQCTTDRDQLRALNDMLLEAKAHWASFGSDTAKDVLVSGDAAAGMIYNGFSAKAREEGANVEYAYPQAGLHRLDGQRGPAARRPEPRRGAEVHELPARPRERRGGDQLRPVHRRGGGGGALPRPRAPRLARAEPARGGARRQLHRGLRRGDPAPLRRDLDQPEEIGGRPRPGRT